MAQLVKRADPPIPDGVYLKLPEAEYFGQDCLGSTDIIRLHTRKWGWWWSSRHNPELANKPQDYFTYGSALHAILLEGVDAYKARFAAAPDKADFDDVVTTIDEMKAALAQAGFNLTGSGSWKSNDWRLAMRANLPGHPCWPNIMEDFEDSLGGRQLIKAVDDRMLRLMREVAVDPGRPDNDAIRNLFADDHPPLAEVSILWTENGIRRRARIDRMFPAFDMDLKSLGNWSGRPLSWVTGEQIAKAGYDIQRADYWVARREALKLIAAGKLYGGSIEQRKWLQTWPDLHASWDWVWLFYQKPEPSGRAPVIFPVMDVTQLQTAPGEWRLSDIMLSGAAKRASALQFYRDTVAEFGLDRPWARVETLHYTDETYTPRIFLPPWINEVEPTQAGAYSEEDDTE